VLKNVEGAEKASEDVKQHFFLSIGTRLDDEPSQNPVSWDLDLQALAIDSFQ
jgi:hypothetical protein